MAMELLQETILSSAIGSVQFSSIPTDGSYSDLFIVMRYEPGSGSDTYYRFNNYTSSNYKVQGFGTTGSNTVAYNDTYSYQILDGYPYNTYNHAIAIINIIDYVYPGKNRTSYAHHGTGEGVGFAGNMWNQTPAVNSVTLTNSQNFQADSVFQLFGVVA